MTRYEVRITSEAQSQVSAIMDYIAKDSTLNAIRWNAGLDDVFKSLDVMPHRSAKALESDFFGGDLRQYNYGSYRIVFRIDEDAAIVRVLFVRHAARRAIGERE